MSVNWKYPDLDRLGRLYPHPSIVLNQRIWYTHKRDGSCTCVWRKDIRKFEMDKKKLKKIVEDDRLDPNEDLTDKLILSSRNMPVAANDVQLAFKSTDEYLKIVELLNDNPQLYLFGEFLLKGKSPARFENHEKAEWIGFDIINPQDIQDEYQPTNPRGFLTIPYVYQLYYQYGIPTPRVMAEAEGFTSIDSIFDFDKTMKDMCEQDKIEGAVAKTTNGIFRWKIKTDLPEPEIKVPREDNTVQLPPLPESEAFGAVDKVFVELGFNTFKDKSVAMPMVAEYIHREMEKHTYGKPRANYYYYYTTYLDERIKAGENSG